MKIHNHYGENNPRYIDGRTLKKYYCIDCNIKITRQHKRCLSCSAKKNIKKRNLKGKNHPSWISGKYSKYQPLLNYCIDCGINISIDAKRCHKCASSGKLGGGYIDGISLKKFYCIDCNKKVHRSRERKNVRCKSCYAIYALLNNKKNLNSKILT